MNNTNKGDIILATAVFFPISVLMLQLFLTDMDLVEYEAYSVVSKIASALPMILALRWIIARKLILFLITYFIIVILISISLIINPANGEFIHSEGYFLILINAPSFLCIAAIKNIHILRRVMLSISFLVFFIGLAFVFAILAGRISFGLYSMSFSYYLLLAAIVFISEKNFGFSILFLITLIMMILLGSRGGVVATILYSISTAVIDRNNRRNLILMIGIIIISLASLFSFFSFFQEYSGVSSRTINLVLHDNILASPLRLEIFAKTWQSILDSPLLGYGIYGDRVLHGTYTHNFVLEILHNYGLFFGSGFILIIIYRIIVVFSKADKNNKKLHLAYLFYGLFPLIVSDSYLNYHGFGIFMGSLFWASTTTEFQSRSVISLGRRSKVFLSRIKNGK